MKVIFATLLLIPVIANAHFGGLDANCGHKDHKNGGYHYHPERCPNNPEPPGGAPASALKTAKSRVDKTDLCGTPSRPQECQNVGREIRLKNEQSGTIYGVTWKDRFDVISPEGITANTPGRYYIIADSDELISCKMTPLP